MRTLKLMADYQCYPLWEASPELVGNIDPSTLPISASLCEKLMRWADIYDSVLDWKDPAHSGFSSVVAELNFNAQGEKLAIQLRDELGPGFVVLFKIISSEKTS